MLIKDPYSTEHRDRLVIDDQDCFFRFHEEHDEDGIYSWQTNFEERVTADGVTFDALRWYDDQCNIDYNTTLSKLEKSYAIALLEGVEVARFDWIIDAEKGNYILNRSRYNPRLTEGWNEFQGPASYACGYCGRIIQSGFRSKSGEHWCREHFER